MEDILVHITKRYPSLVMSIRTVSRITYAKFTAMPLQCDTDIAIYNSLYRCLIANDIHSLIVATARIFLSMRDIFKLKDAMSKLLDRDALYAPQVLYDRPETLQWTSNIVLMLFTLSSGEFRLWQITLYKFYAEFDDKRLIDVELVDFTDTMFALVCCREGSVDLYKYVYKKRKQMYQFDQDRLHGYYCAVDIATLERLFNNKQHRSEHIEIAHFIVNSHDYINVAPSQLETILATHDLETCKNKLLK